MLEVAMEELKKMAADFYKVTGLKIVLFNDERRFIYSYPDTMCEFCKKVREHAGLKDGCFECDNIGFDECERKKEPYIYTCHMGLNEAVSPIYENDIVIGYIMIGQILCSENIGVAEAKTEESTKRYGISPVPFKDMLKDMKKTDEAYIRSAVSMMSMCASYLYFNKIIKRKNDILSAQIREYIESHINEKLTVSELCAKFFVSKTGLYNISRQSFGMGITDYIRSMKLERAKNLLETSEKRVADVALLLGYDDVNYFIRIFKKKVGMTPNKYRNRKER